MTQMEQLARIREAMTLVFDVQKRHTAVVDESPEDAKDCTPEQRHSELMHRRLQSARVELGRAEDLLLKQLGIRGM